MSANRSCTETTQRVAVYAKAARLLERAKTNGSGYVKYCGCCEAISAAIPAELEGADLESPFAECFRPDAAPMYWWGDCICFMPETRDERVLALCFMAAMVEAGDA